MLSVVEMTEAVVQEYLRDEATGHDWWHADRVRKNALTIQAVEGGDRLVLELASLLHDVGDRKVIAQDEDNPEIAHRFLQQMRVGATTIHAVLYVITNMSYSKSLERHTPMSEEPIELQIGQDADRLDALGAIGIGRAFAFGGSRGRPLHDPTIAPQEFASRDEYIRSQSTTLNHFHEKLFKFQGTFNTEYAEHLAAGRIAFMREFHERFLDEWDGQV